MTFAAAAWKVWSRAPGHAVTVATVALLCVVSAGFLFRRAERGSVSISDLAGALPGVVGSALVWWAVPPPACWSAVGSAVFVGGSGFAVLSLAALGRCFGIFPARRGVVQRGPYRWIRHPAYAGEGLAVLAAAAEGGPLAWGLSAAVLTALVVRIEVEERVLRQDPTYLAYAQRVRWRWLPGVW